MMFPYWQFWFNHVLNSKDEYLKYYKVDKRMHILDAANCPEFFGYGAKKPLIFHSDQWLSELDKAKDCKQVGFEGGHWIMTDKPKEINEHVLAWLDDTQSYV